MKQRLDYIDRTRGILIILVVIGHIWQSGYVHYFIYGFHMPAFFAISGILLYHTQSYKKSFKDFVFSRLYSFGIPFAFFEVLGCLTDIIRHGVTLNIKGYMFNTLSFRFNEPEMWFLAALFGIEILFVGIYKLIKKDKLVLIVMLAVFLTSFIIPGENGWLATARQICYFSAFFTCGFFFNSLLDRINKPLILIAWLAVLVISLVFGKRENYEISVANAAFIISFLLGSYAIIQTGKKPLPEKLDRWITYAGKNTIIIFGTHRLYYSVMGVLLGITDYASTPVGTGLIILLAVIILEIPTIYIINRWLPFLAGKHYKRKVKTA